MFFGELFMPIKKHIKILFVFVFAAFLSFFCAICSPKKTEAATASDYKQLTVEYEDIVFTRRFSYTFDYSDLFFENNRFNGTLARASMALASAVALKDKMADYLNELGFEVLCQENYETALTSSSNVAVYTIASKQVEYDGKEFTLYGVFIRGTNVTEEWYSNLNIGQDTEHMGFSVASNEIYAKLSQLVADRESSKIWIMGHSRGAGIGNLLAAKINKEQSVALPENVCAYNFACPSTTTEPVAYNNIFNINIAGDIVASLPLNSWGYDANGVNYVVGAEENEKANGIFYQWTGVDYQGNTSTTNFESYMAEWCPTIADYDTVKFGSSPHILLEKIIMGMLQGNMNNLTFADVGSNWKAWKVLVYFQENATAIMHAHSKVSYLAFMEAMYPHEHVYNYLSDNNATCTEDGTLTAVCYCGDEIRGISDVGSATGHEYVSSHDSLGNLIYTCINCGNSYYYNDIELAEIDKIPDVEYLGEAVCPSFTVWQSGNVLEEGKDYIVSYENNVAVGRAKIILNGIGNYFGTKTIEFNIVEHIHIAGEYTVTQAPTCTEKGVQTALCTVCGETMTESVPALGHDYEGFLSENGVETLVCTRCEERYVVYHLEYSEIIFEDNIFANGTVNLDAITVVFGEITLKKNDDYILSVNSVVEGETTTIYVHIEGLSPYTGEKDAESIVPSPQDGSGDDHQDSSSNEESNGESKGFPVYIAIGGGALFVLFLVALVIAAKKRK